MSTVEETLGAKTPLGSSIAEGVNTISMNQEVTFILYVKLILPIDGSVFWVNSSLMSDSALYNAAQYGQTEYDKMDYPAPKRHLQVKGSLHYATEVKQLEDRTPSFNHMIFTSLTEVTDFNLVNPNMMYVALHEGIKFAFNSRQSFYRQADIYHYRGDALYSIMNTQLLDSLTDFDTIEPVVSNSLPIWLTLNKFFPMYPSYLVAPNNPPPYASIDIDPAQTTALQDFQLLDKHSSPNQLVRDTVKITIYGKRNNDALNFVNYVLQYSIDTDNIGLLNMPVIQDEKATQTEFGILAMKKTITFDISYYQSTVNNITRKLIESAVMSITEATP